MLTFERFSRTKLNPRLDLVTRDMVEEATDALDRVFNDVVSTSEPQIRCIMADMHEVISRVSSRVFVGKQFARNAEWLDIAQRYAFDLQTASMVIRLFPAALQSLANWTLPICWKARKHVSNARRLVRHHTEQLSEHKKSNEEQPVAPPTLLSWMAEVVGDRPFDYVAAQLGISIVAMTTAETAAKALLALGKHPEVVPPLREEIASLLDTDGWTKKSISSMELLDSFLKEVLRLERGALGKCQILPGCSQDGRSSC